MPLGHHLLGTNYTCYNCRTSGGRLHLLSDVGKIPLADATLIEEPSDSEREDDGQYYDFIAHNRQQTTTTIANYKKKLNSR